MLWFATTATVYAPNTAGNSTGKPRNTVMSVLLAALWVAWRHDFTPGGIALGLLALFGAVMLLPYLLWATANAAGDVRVLTLGRRRAAGASE